MTGWRKCKYVYICTCVCAYRQWNMIQPLERNLAIYDNLGGPCLLSQMEKEISDVLTYMWNLRRRQKTQTHSNGFLVWGVGEMIEENQKIQT